MSVRETLSLEEYTDEENKGGVGRWSDSDKFPQLNWLKLDHTIWEGEIRKTTVQGQTEQTVQQTTSWPIAGKAAHICNSSCVGS
jgi:hypothetical protein